MSNINDSINEHIRITEIMMNRKRPVFDEKCKRCFNLKTKIGCVAEPEEMRFAGCSNFLEIQVYDEEKYD